jgi:hypothetical protein
MLVVETTLCAAQSQSKPVLLQMLVTKVAGKRVLAHKQRQAHGFRGDNRHALLSGILPVYTGCISQAPAPDNDFRMPQGAFCIELAWCPSKFRLN